MDGDLHGSDAAGLKLLCGGSDGSSDDTRMSDTVSVTTGCSSDKPVWQSFSGAGLGDPDCVLVGDGWSLQAHKAVLKGEWRQPQQGGEE